MQTASILNPGDIFDFFEISNILGLDNPKFKVLSVHPGGMGICYKLQSMETKRNFGLKSIRSDLIKPGNLERFYDEINVWLTASACDGVAEAITVIRFNEMPAILSPWYVNGDLSSWISKLHPAHKIEVLIRTVKVLSWAQSKLGIIHRDLKPENILLDEKYLSYLSDWGLARPLNKLIRNIESQKNNRIIERPDRTHSGNIIGTLLYMSPEQFRNPGKVDHRSDIYSLGCIMYEMETGAPPFLGKTPYEIIYKHFNKPAPKLGGAFKRTKLGLEKIIDRCLAKSPDQRYSTYGELRKDLFYVAKKKSTSIARCKISERYQRYPLGKGEKEFSNVRKEAKVKNKNGEYGILDYREIQPFLVEAINLAALGQYSESAKLLKPLVIPGMLEGNGPWHFGLNVVLNYAYSLSNISGKNEEALRFFHKLENYSDKPSEFYVNYSLALLKSADYSKAEKICSEGLQQFPADYDLLGNYTIALKHQGKLEKAYNNAIKRIQIRRDVHSIEELVSVLFELMKSARNIDLPKAIHLAEEQFNLIEEGLQLNPNHFPLKMFKIKLFRFINDSGKAMEISKDLAEDVALSNIYRQLAFTEMVEILSEVELHDQALEWINQLMNSIDNKEIKQRLLLTQMKIYADKYMLGRLTKEGERVVVRQVVDYFVNDHIGKNVDPHMTARVLDWVGETLQAKNTLRKLLKNSPNNWKARQELVFLLLRQGLIHEAVSEANLMVEMYPWRAESYDTFSYILKTAGDVESSIRIKKKGDEIFKQEIRLYDQIRNKYQS